MIGGLLALFNPMPAAITATTLGGLALLFVAGLQGYSAWQTRELRGTVSSIIVSGSALLMTIILLWGPLGNGGLVRFVLCLLLFASGGVILWWGRSLKKGQGVPSDCGFRGCPNSSWVGCAFWISCIYCRRFWYHSWSGIDCFGKRIYASCTSAQKSVGKVNRELLQCGRILDNCSTGWSSHFPTIVSVGF